MYTKVLNKLGNELYRGQGKWDENRPEGTPKDKDKGLGEWISFAQQELNFAREAAYQSYDKAEALRHMLKVAAHCMNAILHIGES